jgi:hypothetical protein
LLGLSLGHAADPVASERRPYRLTSLKVRAAFAKSRTHPILVLEVIFEDEDEPIRDSDQYPSE